MPPLKSFEDGAALFRRMFSQHFTRLTGDDWLAYARRSFKLERQQLVPTYDAQLAKTMEDIDFGQPLPPLWAAFDALGRVPLMVIRGQNSDLLSEETVAAMRSRRPDMEVVTVPDQGHAPILSGPHLLGRLAAFVASCEPASLPFP
jgi:pimeloyl-ACP methyl ester carboxylesterase